jgi:hypothetical protein
MNGQTRLDRRDLGRIGIGALALGAVTIAPRALLAQPQIESTERGEMPTTGGLRPGPLGLNPQPLTIAGFRPLSITVDTAGIAAPVEQVEIVDGIMQDPSGPWVVAWYKETGRLGVPDANICVAGHVDYWNVGPAVFYNIRNLVEGDPVDMAGEDGKTYRYEVQWVELYDAANAPIQDIVGSTGEQSLTIITCGGEFNYQTGEYVSRTVVRCRFSEVIEA